MDGAILVVVAICTADVQMPQTRAGLLLANQVCIYAQNFHPKGVYTRQRASLTASFFIIAVRLA